jgi:hypothetical protein
LERSIVAVTVFIFVYLARNTTSPEPLRDLALTGLTLVSALRKLKDAEHEIMLSDPKAYRFRPVSLADEKTTATL